MAVLSITPHVSDMVTLKQLYVLFKKTGHSACETTLREWIAKHEVPTERRGRADVVSYTLMLQVHREEIARRASE